MSKQSGPKTDTLLLLYDAECNLCLATVAKLRRIRTASELIMVPLQSADHGSLPQGVEPEALRAELHLIDGAGRMYRGADAVVRIMGTLPGLAWLTFFYRVPGLRGIAHSVYRLIAKYRYRLFGRKTDVCDNGSCRIPQTHVKPPSGGSMKKGDES